MSCKLMSIDSSMNSTGISFFVDSKYRDSMLLESKKEEKNKLETRIKDINKIIETEHPDIVVTELTVVQRNAQTQRNLSMLLGAIYGKCIDNDIFYSSYRPTEWRSLVKDEDNLPRKRDALKQWSIEKASELSGVNFADDNISDSYLIGLAYIRQWTNNKEGV